LGDVMNYIQMYMVRRLLRTEYVKGEDEPTQANFDSAYEADITEIVMRVLRSQGLTQ
jgi:hypothetical protein